ncbi:hypothetical protein [Streptomyces sp. NPDC005573]|uniref:hypothetical protein n=1 Tax=Streptomyces sp. NPDC005573 TaxID=3156890 RepID=UPI0033B97CCC
MTSENTNNPEAGEASSPPDAPAGPRRSRPGRVVAVVGTAVLALAVVAGVGCTAVTVNGADRAPGAPGWRLPDFAKREAAEEKPAGIRAMLLSYGDRYGRGPDIGEFGSDTELSGRQATVLQKQSLRNLPRSERRLMEREIDKNPVKGIAMRSYVSTADAAHAGKNVFTVEIELSRMANQRIARSVGRAQRDFFDAVKVFTEGPEIEGHQDQAGCYVLPAGPDGKLGQMLCSGYVGDVLVIATATAAEPLDKKGVAEIVRAQLDRIKDPGEAV